MSHKEDNASNPLLMPSTLSSPPATATVEEGTEKVLAARRSSSDGAKNKEEDAEKAKPAKSTFVCLGGSPSDDLCAADSHPSLVAYGEGSDADRPFTPTFKDEGRGALGEKEGGANRGSVRCSKKERLGARACGDSDRGSPLGDDAAMMLPAERTLNSISLFDTCNANNKDDPASFLVPSPSSPTGGAHSVVGINGYSSSDGIGPFDDSGTCRDAAIISSRKAAATAAAAASNSGNSGTNNNTCKQQDGVTHLTVPAIAGTNDTLTANRAGALRPPAAAVPIGPLPPPPLPNASPPVVAQCSSPHSVIVARTHQQKTTAASLGAANRSDTSSSGEEHERIRRQGGEGEQYNNHGGWGSSSSYSYTYDDDDSSDFGDDDDDYYRYDCDGRTATPTGSHASCGGDSSCTLEGSPQRPAGSDASAKRRSKRESRASALAAAVKEEQQKTRLWRLKNFFGSGFLGGMMGSSGSDEEEEGEGDRNRRRDSKDADGEKGRRMNVIVSSSTTAALAKERQRQRQGSNNNNNKNHNDESLPRIAGGEVDEGQRRRRRRRRRSGDEEDPSKGEAAKTDEKQKRLRRNNRKQRRRHGPPSYGSPTNNDATADTDGDGGSPITRGGPRRATKPFGGFGGATIRSSASTNFFPSPHSRGTCAYDEEREAARRAARPEAIRDAQLRRKEAEFVGFGPTGYIERQRGQFALLMMPEGGGGGNVGAGNDEGFAGGADNGAPPPSIIAAGGNAAAPGAFSSGGSGEAAGGSPPHESDATAGAWKNIRPIERPFFIAALIVAGVAYAVFAIASIVATVTNYYNLNGCNSLIRAYQIAAPIFFVVTMLSYWPWCLFFAFRELPRRLTKGKKISPFATLLSTICCIGLIGSTAVALIGIIASGGGDKALEATCGLPYQLTRNVSIAYLAFTFAALVGYMGYYSLLVRRSARRGGEGVTTKGGAPVFSSVTPLPPPKIGGNTATNAAGGNNTTTGISNSITNRTDSPTASDAATTSAGATPAGTPTSHLRGQHTLGNTGTFGGRDGEGPLAASDLRLNVSSSVAEESASDVGGPIRPYVPPPAAFPMPPPDSPLHSVSRSGGISGAGGAASTHAQPPTASEQSSPLSFWSRLFRRGGPTGAKPSAVNVNSGVTAAEGGVEQRPAPAPIVERRPIGRIMPPSSALPAIAASRRLYAAQQQSQSNGQSPHHSRTHSRHRRSASASSSSQSAATRIVRR